MHSKSRQCAEIPSPFLLGPGCRVAGVLLSLGLCSAGQINPTAGLAPLSFKVPPGASSAVSFHTAADAQCLIRAQKSKASGEALSVFADDSGTATFYVEASSRAGDTVKLAASCSSEPTADARDRGGSRYEADLASISRSG